MMLPGCTPITLGSVTTISYSMYRNKKPVINIGRTNINGVTRGSRIFAGTIIFTLINQHWLRDVQAEVSYLANMKDLKADELPLFDIMIVSANEYGSAVVMYMFGIDFTDEAQTISVQDLFTENTFSFVARDIETFQAINIFSSNGNSGSATQKESISQRFYVVDSNVSWNDILNKENAIKDKVNKTPINTNKDFNNGVPWPWNGGSSPEDGVNSEYRDYNYAGKLYNTPLNRLMPSREYYYDSSLNRAMSGSDILDLQQALKDSRYYDSFDGFYTDAMSNAVRTYQKDHNLYPTGNVDYRTYMSLMKDRKDKKSVVLNRNGAKVYRDPNLSSPIIKVLKYGTYINSDLKTLKDKDGNEYYEVNGGYVRVPDIFSGSEMKTQYSFPDVRLGDRNVYVTILQNALNNIYPEHTINVDGIYGEDTLEYVNKFKKEHALEIDAVGLVDRNTWEFIGNATSNKDKNIKEDLKISFNMLPGEYALSYNDFSNSMGIQNEPAALILEPYNIIFENQKNNLKTIKFTIIIEYYDSKTKDKRYKSNVINKSVSDILEFNPLRWIDPDDKGKEHDTFYYDLINCSSYNGNKDYKASKAEIIIWPIDFKQVYKYTFNYR